MQEKPTLEDTLALMRDLRARCEWDAAQTHESLRPYLIEEAHELDDAIRVGRRRAAARGARRPAAAGALPLGGRRGARRVRLRATWRGLITKMKRAASAPLRAAASARAVGADEGEEARQSIVDGLPAEPAVAAPRASACRIAPPASASTGRMSTGRRRRWRRSWPRCARSCATAQRPTAHARARRSHAARGGAGRPAVRGREPLPQSAACTRRSRSTRRTRSSPRAFRRSSGSRASAGSTCGRGLEELDALWDEVKRGVNGA